VTATHSGKGTPNPLVRYDYPNNPQEHKKQEICRINWLKFFINETRSAFSDVEEEDLQSCQDASFLIFVLPSFVLLLFFLG